jgi:hypothetical protein
MSDVKQRVTVTVESKGSVNQGRQMVKVYAPDLGIKKFPTQVWMPEDVAAGMLPNQSYEVMLARGKPKKQNPEYSSDYYWDYAGEPGPSDVPTDLPFDHPADEASQKAAEPQRASGYVTDRDRNTSIVRQVAAKAAVELLVAYPGSPEDADMMERFAYLADCIVGWIQAE